MRWIRPEKRAAIYARDGGRCVYCLAKKNLSLDHVRPRSKGGSNRATNLITACFRCNLERSASSLDVFAGPKLAAEIRRMVRRRLPT